MSNPIGTIYAYEDGRRDFVCSVHANSEAGIRKAHDAGLTAVDDQYARGDGPAYAVTSENATRVACVLCFQRGDRVSWPNIINGLPNYGDVMRVAKDGSWVDVAYDWAHEISVSRMRGRSLEKMRKVTRTTPFPPERRYTIDTRPGPKDPPTH